MLSPEYPCALTAHLLLWCWSFDDASGLHLHRSNFRKESYLNKSWMCARCFRLEHFVDDCWTAWVRLYLAVQWHQRQAHHAVSCRTFTFRCRPRPAWHVLSRSVYFLSCYHWFTGFLHRHILCLLSFMVLLYVEWCPLKGKLWRSLEHFLRATYPYITWPTVIKHGVE